MDVCIPGLLEGLQRLPSGDLVYRSSVVQLTRLEDRIVLPRGVHRCIPVLGSVEQRKVAISAKWRRNFAGLELRLAWAELDELLFQRRREQRLELLGQWRYSLVVFHICWFV